MANLMSSCRFAWGSLASFLLLTSPAFAQQFVPPHPGSFRPPNTGIPRRTEGAGTRGPCITGDQSLVPIVPTNNFSLTTQARPTFFLYIPPSKATAVEFVLLDETEKPVYQGYAPLPAGSGIVGYTLGPGSEPLVVGKTYHWQATLVCNAQDPSENPFVESWVQRVQPSTQLATDLSQADPQTASDLYAANGIWQDALNTLAVLRQANPQVPNLAADWQTLLTSVQLQSLTGVPLSQPLVLSRRDHLQNN